MSEEIKKSPNANKKLTKKRKILWIGSIFTALIIIGGITTLFIMKPWFHDNYPIVEDPSNPMAFAGEPTKIDVECSDDIGIDSVILSYSIDQVFWSNITMIGSGNTEWKGFGYIPAHNIETTIYYKIFANDTSNQITLNDRNGFYWSIYTGSRKAILVNSANDFSGEEPDGAFNGSPDSDFTIDTGNWEKNTVNMSILHDGTGYMDFVALGEPSGYANFSYDWIANSYSLDEYVEYNISADIELLGPEAANSTRIGLQWTNSSGIARMDWSDYAPEGLGYHNINITGVCNNETNYEITGLKLIVSINLTENVVGSIVHLDNVKIDKWIAVNTTDPTNQGSSPPPTYLDCDGFPAQTLQIYWILKNQGYTDDNILLMLYNKNDADGIIDIYAPWHPLDTTTNDLAGAVVDVANDSVTATRLKFELNASFGGGFASEIEPNDQLIIVLTNHGSNAILSDGNATFHFEADNSFITEYEFFDLVEEINCSRMMINIDCCFSGNFIQSNPGVFYDIPNAVLVSASSNVAAWYWIDNSNGNFFAGSWFFNPFWEQLSYGIDIMNAFIFAKNFIPFGRINPLGITQMPLIWDPMNLANTWSFISNPKL
jgi:hypothetical protein